MLPGLGDQPLAVRSTTSDPFSAAAFAILPRFDPPIKTVLPLLCTVGGAAMLREKEGGLAIPTQNFSFSSVKMAQITIFSSDSVKGVMVAGMGLSKAPDTKLLILGFLVPAGSERGAVDVYTLLPPRAGSRTSLQNNSLESGKQLLCPAPVERIQQSRSNMSCTNVSDPTPPIGTGMYGTTLMPGPIFPAILVSVSTSIGA